MLTFLQRHPQLTDLAFLRVAIVATTTWAIRRVGSKVAKSIESTQKERDLEFHHGCAMAMPAGCSTRPRGSRSTSACRT
jgi:hypothetical protein